MSKPILYQAALSPGVRAVRMVAHVIGLELELRDVDLIKGEHMSESFLKMNPQHTVPTLDDNGIYIGDSHAITVYLLEKYAKNHSLYPNDPYIRARINQRLHFDSGSLFAKLYTLVIPVVRMGAKEFKQENVNAIIQAYEMLNTFLKDDPYLVGNSVTLADLTCVTSASSLHNMVPIDAAKFPNIHSWFDRMAKLPYYDELNGQLAVTHGNVLRDLLKRNQNA